MTVAQLVATLERRAAEAEAVGATASVANVYRVVLAELQAMDGTATTPATAPDPPALERHLTPQEVEALLHVPRGYAYRHRHQLGGVKVGKYLRFPESAVRRRLERSR